MDSARRVVFSRLKGTPVASNGETVDSTHTYKQVQHVLTDRLNVSLQLFQMDPHSYTPRHSFEAVRPHGVFPVGKTPKAFRKLLRRSYAKPLEHSLLATQRTQDTERPVRLPYLSRNSVRLKPRHLLRPALLKQIGM